MKYSKRKEKLVEKEDAMKLLLLTNSKVLMQKQNETFVIPELEALSFINIDHTPIQFDAYDEENYSFVLLDKEYELPKEYCYKTYRELWVTVDENTLAVVGRAIQLGFWHSNSKYCGRCSAEFKLREDELGKRCECGNMSYPAAYPAVIVSVKKGNEVLLVKTKYQQYPFYSSVAGFVDPGERFEAAVAREVMEEVGLEIENVKYFDSQPFAPSNNIMIGFTADYKAGEIVLQESEIAEAKWFDLDALPPLPPVTSLPTRMIASYRK